MPNPRWAEEFSALAASVWTPEAWTDIAGNKALPVQPLDAPLLLRVLGLLDRDATMRPARVRKVLQLNHMIRLLRPPLEELQSRGEPLHIVDVGCGLSYLTLSLAWCFRHVFEHPVRIIGVDRKTALIEEGRHRARSLELDDLLKFVAAPIDAIDPTALYAEAFGVERAPDVVLGLHACDTATDDAIALGVAHGASLIAVAPCCQAELARGWSALESERGAFAPVWSTPHLRREIAATVTDTMRMELLRGVGYETRTVEFVASEHTPKNTLIRAMYREPAVMDFSAYEALRKATGGVGIGLAARLARVSGTR